MAKGRILAIDDEEFFRTLYRDLLEAEGYYVRTAASGREALTCLHSEDFDLVVDSDIPLLPAARIAQILRANPRTEGLACIFIGREGEEIADFQRHRDQIVPRPCNREQLLLSIAAFFSRRERTEQVDRQEKEVAGSLDQISLVALLQAGSEPAGPTFALGRNDRRALRRLLAFFATRFTGEPSPEEVA